LLSANNMTVCDNMLSVFANLIYRSRLYCRCGSFCPDTIIDLGNDRLIRQVYRLRLDLSSTDLKRVYVDLTQVHYEVAV
jgi:hypothetical protein